MSRTILTVFEDEDTVNEPVISLPMAGRLSFRQIGMVVGLSVIAPMMIYSGLSEHLLDALPEPVWSFSVTGSASQAKVTWDVIVSLIPVPFGLGLGIPRPKLLPMDQLLLSFLMFSIRHTSVRQKTRTQKKKKKKRSKQGTGKSKSRFAGFAQRDTLDDYHRDSARPEKETFAVNVSEIGMPKNITVTLYHADGRPMRNTLVRAYVDDMLQSTITTDSDGVMGMTFAPKNEGAKRLRIMADGAEKPVVDVQLDVRVGR